MVAATQPRSLTVTIKRIPTSGTVNWSQEFLDLTIGFESYSQGSGLILKRGTIRFFIADANHGSGGQKIEVPRTLSPAVCNVVQAQ